MRFFHAILAFTIIAFLTIPSPLCGQGYNRTRQTPGLFGPRSLGQPLKPRPSQFDGGVQRGPSGSFAGVNRPSGNMFEVPWRHNQDISPLIYAPFMPLEPLEPAATEVVAPQETPPQPEMPAPQVPAASEPYAPEWNSPEPNAPQWNAPAAPISEPAGPTEQ